MRFRHSPGKGLRLVAVGGGALGLASAVAFGVVAVGPHYRAAAAEPRGDNTFERLPPRERPAELRSGHGGQLRSPRLDLDIHVVPDAVVRDKNGKETLEYHLELSAQLDGTGRYNFQVDFTDDLRQPVGSVHASTLAAGSDDAPAVTETFTTPPNLADGYYQAEITAVGASAKRTATNTARIYLQVVQGRVMELSINDWHKQSRSRYALGPLNSPPPDQSLPTRSR